MAREFGNKGGRSGGAGGRSGGYSGGRSGGRDGRSEGRSGEKSPGFSRSASDRPRSGGRDGGRDGGRSDRPQRASYGEDRPRRSYGDRDEGGAGRPPRRSYNDDAPKRSYGDREDRPKRSYSEDRPARRFDRDDKPRSPRGGDRDRHDRNDRGGDTPRRYIRDEGSAPRKPRAEGRYAERKPFKGRFEEADAGYNDAPRERKPRMGAEKLSGGTSTPRVRIQANVWGQHAVKAAWLNPNRTISALFTCPEELKLFQPVIEEARAAGIHRPEPTLVGREDLDKHLPRDAVHQGLAITAAEPEEAFIQDIINRGATKERSIVVILDQVTDPHNVGAIIRSVCALGGDGVVMQRRHAPELTGVVAKAACGAIEHVLVAYETNLSRSIEALQAEGYMVAGLDERGEQTVDALREHKKLALVLGAEGPGLRHLVKEHCDLLVKINMEGPIPSLNVSNAAAVALYAAVV